MSPDPNDEEGGDFGAEAQRRASVLRPLVQAYLSRAGSLESGIGDAVWELGVSRTTVWRWIRRLAAEGGRTSALVPRKRGWRSGSVMVPGDVEGIIEEHLTRYYLRRERPSLARVVTEIRSACLERGLQPPTRRTVQRRLDAMDAREVMKAREGAKAARQRFAPVTGRNRSERPLDVVQIDHTPADIILVDSFERKPIGRPWVLESAVTSNSANKLRRAMRAATYAKALKSVRADTAFALQSPRPDVRLFCLAAIAAAQSRPLAKAAMLSTGLDGYARVALLRAFEKEPRLLAAVDRIVLRNREKLRRAGV